MPPKGSVYEGKSYEEAVAKGLADMGLTRAEALVTTIEEGKGGFLGFGARPYRVSVMRRPGGAIREPEEGGDRRRGRDDRGARGARPERAGRGGRDEKRDGRPERAGRGGRDEKRAERPAREERRGEVRGERRPGAEAPRAEERRPDARGERRDEPRRDEPRRDERPARGERRDERRDEPRGERRPEGRREGRGNGRDEQPREERRPDVRVEGRGEPRAEGRRAERREERRPEPVEELRDEARAMPIEEVPAGAVESRTERSDGDEGAEGDDRRRRRRRGRRGGRGRRRDGAPGTHAEGANGTSPVADEMTEPESDFADEGSESDVQEQAVAMSAGVAREPEPRSEPRAELRNEPRSEPRDEPRDEPRAEPAPAMSASRPMREREPRRASFEREPRRESFEREPRRESERDERTPTFTEGELAETSRRVTADLLAAMGFEAKVEVVVQGTRADVTAEVSRDDDLLNGRKGEVRQALQHLLNRFINRGEGSHYHLQLEINDFWKRRELELEEMARALATQAAESRTEVVTEYLNSQERRIVHVTLKEDPRVRTYALGTGMIKRVAVAPADFPERSGDDEA